ncbi:SPOR domain-containing protein [Swingsia samuiensis]|uniref:SPOR domain-containing protein n=1 Tax=Swingsia samuiensis TaxID=1293412 RepID=A0A4Y6UIT6_9PROT|nr:SPOR domain-containing protein [Swingsia samuiensis]QDH17472.1 SPOR domain-containing protein [Swingsia samuiensis]
MISDDNKRRSSRDPGDYAEHGASAPPPSSRLLRERMSGDYDPEPPPRRRVAANERKAGFSSVLGNDPATRKLVGGAIGIGAVLVAAVGGWSLMGGHHGGIPIIGPPPGPVRDIPADPGGMQIMSDDGGVTDMTGNGVAHLAPAPEQPDTKGLARQYGVSPQSAATVTQSAGDSAQKQTVASSQQEAMGASGAQQENVKTSKENVSPEGAVGNGSVAAQNPAQSDGVKTASEHDQSLAKTDTVDVQKKTPNVSQTDDNGGDAISDDNADQKQSVSSPKAVVSAPVAPQRPAPRVAPQKAAPVIEKSKDISAPKNAGKHEVQLAALDSEAGAKKEWETLRHQSPALFAGHTPLFEKTTRGDKTFIRLRIGGFEDLKAARGYCIKLHAQSISCTPAQF